jgi:beta-glucosidase
MAGAETIQLYIRDEFSTVTRPVLELKAYDKIYLHPGESKKVTFSLTAEAFAYYNIDMKYLAERGDFIIYTGSSSASKSLKKASIYLTQNIYFDEK